MRAKFRLNKNLRDMLLETGTKELINLYSEASLSNLFWGVVDN